jgi:protein-S-isoprenylcysteine O-methyltransferase Ste14
MNMTFRRLHRKIAPILFLPLLASALTGVFYRLGRSWFGIPNSVAEFLMVIHQGEYLGVQLKPIYVLLLGLGLVGMIVTGLTMLKRYHNRSERQSGKLDMRNVHRILAPFIFLPLIVSALTGVIYRLGRSWFGMSSEQAEFFMMIHQGSYLGSFFRSIYVLLVGVGLGVMLITGINMIRLFGKSSPPKGLEKGLSDL